MLLKYDIYQIHTTTGVDNGVTNVQDLIIRICPYPSVSIRISPYPSVYACINTYTVQMRSGRTVRHPGCHIPITARFLGNTRCLATLHPIERATDGQCARVVRPGPGASVLVGGPD